MVAAVHVVNRLRGLHERAEGLSLWVSDNQTDWRKIWQADRVAAQWTIEPEEPIACRFLKIGLPGRGILHLNQVTVFVMTQE